MVVKHLKKQFGEPVQIASVIRLQTQVIRSKKTNTPLALTPTHSNMLIKSSIMVVRKPALETMPQMLPLPWTVLPQCCSIQATTAALTSSCLMHEAIWISDTSLRQVPRLMNPRSLMRQVSLKYRGRQQPVLSSMVLRPKLMIRPTDTPSLAYLEREM